MNAQAGIDKKPTALLVVAHGSRHAEANADLFRLAEVLAANGEFACVEPAFLELATPNVEEGGERCVARGARRVVIVPYFLSAGIHVRRDLDELRRRLGTRHPDVEVLLAEPLGPHPALATIARQRVAEALASLDPRFS